MRFLLSLSALLLVCCDHSPSPTADARPLVVATTTMVADLVRQVGGEEIQLAALMGPGVDPHLYKPGAMDAQHFAKAAVIFFSGLHLEGRMAELLEKRGIAVTRSIPATELLQSDGHPDPHVWGDARLWARCIDPVVEGLGAALPEKKAAFVTRGETLKKTYEALHEQMLAEVAKVPAAHRKLITSHDAFAYFGRAYGFEVVGVQGISTVSEAGLADVAKTVDFVKAQAVRAIFVESSVPHATIERIAKDSGVKIGGELFSDALGAGQTYEQMLRHNVHTIVTALQ
jgi:manganese/zinc/iron transport system substrate-binding protein